MKTLVEVSCTHRGIPEETMATDSARVVNSLCGANVVESVLG